MSVPAVHRLSVIIPCYNGQAYLGEALDSILSQPLEGLEIILVDDGSTDRSIEIARSRGAVVTVIQQKRAGSAAARLAGISAASGEFLAFCDADDVWCPDRFPGQALFMEASGSAACCGLSQSFLTPELRMGEGADWTLPPQYYRSFGNLLLRRDVMRRVGRLPTDVPDLHIPFFAALEDLGVKVERFDRVVTLRRVHQANASRQGGAQFAGYTRAIKNVLERRRNTSAGNAAGGAE